MEGRAKEKEIKKRKEGKEVFCIRVNRYEANIDDHDYLCRFASCAPLTSIHRRSHPYDPGRWDNKEPGYPLRVHPVILSKQIRVLLMEIIRGSPWLLEIWISTWERRCSVTTLFVLDESSRTLFFSRNFLQIKSFVPRGFLRDHFFETKGARLSSIPLSRGAKVLWSSSIRRCLL